MSLWQIKRKRCPHCRRLYSRVYIKQHMERCASKAREEALYDEGHEQ